MDPNRNSFEISLVGDYSLALTEKKPDFEINGKLTYSTNTIYIHETQLYEVRRLLDKGEELMRNSQITSTTKEIERLEKEKVLLDAKLTNLKQGLASMLDTTQ